MTGKLLGGAVLFCAACLLIYLGAKALVEVWWILLILAVIIAGVVIAVRVRKNNSRW